MIEATLESNSANGPFVVFNFKEGHNERVYVRETAPYRIAIKSDSDRLAVFLGNLQLAGYRVGEIVYFSLEFEQPSEAINYKFFGNIFNNLIGNSEFVFETEEGIQSFEVSIESVKTNENEVQAWMDAISRTFPIYYSPKSLSPISYLPARTEQKANFSSLYSLLKETEEILDNVLKKSKTSGYLKRKYIRNILDTGGNEVFDYSKPQNWFSQERKWGASSSKNSGQIKVKHIYFESYNLPKTCGFKSYNTDLNRILATSVSSLRVDLEIYKKTILENMGELSELGTQFRSQHSKYQIGLRFQKTITSTISKIASLLETFSRLGIELTTKAKPPVGDRRYVDLISDISTINLLSVAYRKYTKFGEEKLGILGLDMIFEMFCYAELVECVQECGFEIQELDQGNSINQFISLWNKNRKIGLRIFYDVPVPKSNEDTNGFPIVDYFQFGANKRPDFLLHFYNGKHEKTAILDAKYKTLQKCTDDFKKFNAGNLLVKYGTKFFAKLPNNLPPFFIGAVCLKDSSKANCELRPMVSDDHVSLTNKPFQEAAIVEIGSSDNSSLARLFQHLVDKFEAYIPTVDENNGSEMSKPNIEWGMPKRAFGKKLKLKHTEIKVIKSNVGSQISRNRSTTAPTLTQMDVAQIKGMLLRGDKPQDIAFWFGVNNGRISEIKSGSSFFDVKPADPGDLPKEGPYPPVRNFLEPNSK